MGGGWRRRRRRGGRRAAAEAEVRRARRRTWCSPRARARRERSSTRRASARAAAARAEGGDVERRAARCGAARAGHGWCRAVQLAARSLHRQLLRAVTVLGESLGSVLAVSELEALLDALQERSCAGHGASARRPAPRRAAPPPRRPRPTRARLRERKRREHRRVPREARPLVASSDRGAPLLLSAHYRSLLTAGLLTAHSSPLTSAYYSLTHGPLTHGSPHAPRSRDPGALGVLSGRGGGGREGRRDRGRRRRRKAAHARPRRRLRHRCAARRGRRAPQALVAVDTVRACMHTRTCTRTRTCMHVCARSCVHSPPRTHTRTHNKHTAQPAVAAPRRADPPPSPPATLTPATLTPPPSPPATLTPRHLHPVQVRRLVLDLRCDQNAACRHALRPLRARIRARSERRAARQRRAVARSARCRSRRSPRRGRVQLAQHAPSGEAYALKTVSKRALLRRGTLDLVGKERRLVRLCAHLNVVELYTPYRRGERAPALRAPARRRAQALLRRDGPLDPPAARFYAACVPAPSRQCTTRGWCAPPPPPPFRPPPPAPPRPPAARSPPAPPRYSPPLRLRPNGSPHCKAQSRLGAPRRAPREPDARPQGLPQAARLRLRHEAAVDERAATLCGCAEYLAPEVLSGEGHGAAADWCAPGRAPVHEPGPLTPPPHPHPLDPHPHRRSVPQLGPPTHHWPPTLPLRWALASSCTRCLRGRRRTPSGTHR